MQQPAARPQFYKVTDISGISILHLMAFSQKRHCAEVLALREFPGQNLRLLDDFLDGI